RAFVAKYTGTEAARLAQVKLPAPSKGLPTIKEAAGVVGFVAFWTGMAWLFMPGLLVETVGRIVPGVTELAKRSPAYRPPVTLRPGDFGKAWQSPLPYSVPSDPPSNLPSPQYTWPSPSSRPAPVPSSPPSGSPSTSPSLFAFPPATSSPPSATVG